MPNHASATIIGHLGKDPQVRITNGGKEMAQFSVAVNTGFKDDKKTTWWNVVCFGKTSEVAARYLSKGSVALFEGEPVLEEYQDKDGNKRTSLKLVVNRLTLLDNKAKDEPETKSPPKKISNDAPFDDDIPF